MAVKVKRKFENNEDDIQGDSGRNLVSKTFKIKKSKKEEDIGGDLVKNGVTDSKTDISVDITKFGKKSKPRFTKKTKHELKSKPNWLEFKKKKKELKKNRREQSNPQYELTLQAKRIWEEVRNRNCDKQKRSQLIIQLHTILKGKLLLLVHSHDMARIVQFMLKFGGEDTRQEVCEELIPHIVNVMLSKYACYCVKKLFKYTNTDYRKRLVDGMRGSVNKMLNNSVATKWLEYAYSTWATQQQKLSMRQELYGNLFKLSKDDTTTNLTDLFEKNPQLKPAVLSTTKALITKALEKKNIMVSSLLHSVLLDYINHCDGVERNEVLELLVESILQLLTSRDGTLVAMNIVWHGTNRTKKAVVKTLKTHIKEISELEHGHLLLLAAFDSIDDTVLVKKALFPELLTAAEEMAVDEIGRRVLLYLTAHRDKLYFHPAEIQLLQRGDEIGNSKKDLNVKHKELLMGIINPLLSFIGGNPKHWLSNSSVSMLTLAVIKAASAADGEVTDLNKLKESLEAIASHIVNEGEKTEIIEDAGLHFVIKKLIKNDENIIDKNKSLDNKTTNDGCTSSLPLFSSILVHLLTESVIKSWVKVNRGCFIIVWLLESSNSLAANELKSKITKNIKSVLKHETFAGAKILFKKIVGT